MQPLNHSIFDRTLGSRWTSYLFMGLAMAIFFKNAWVSEDAYILFRSIEQFVAGNGPRWNPHERVQVFTCPLWFWLLTVFRLFSADVFLNAVTASALLTLATMAVLRLITRSGAACAFLLLMLLCSKGFFDFTSSGLENPLGYLLVACYAYYYCRLADPAEPARRFLNLAAVLSLVLVCRHDLITLLAVPTLYLFVKRRNDMKAGTWIALGAATLLPLAAWSAFSLLYYGSIVPNTAYAKLGSGVARGDLIVQGWNYLLAAFRYDTVTFIVLAAGVTVSLTARAGHLRYLGFGILLNLAYVVLVGGDFMQGRFLSYAYLLASIVLVLARPAGRAGRITAFCLTTVLAVYALAYPHTPVKTPLTYHNREMVLGVADERGHYFHTSSLYSYLTTAGTPYFPPHRWSREGWLLAQSHKRCVVMNTVGYFGYWAGLEKIIVDPLALTDPLLARIHIPNTTHWRTGHFERDIPDGYIETILTGNDLIADPGINEYNRKLKIITQSDRLFTRERIKTIIAMNLGRYDHLLGNK